MAEQHSPDLPPDMTLEDIEKSMTEGRRGRMIPAHEGKYVDSRCWCTFCDDAVIPWCWKQDHVAICEDCGYQYNAVAGCDEHPYKDGFNLKTKHVEEEWDKMADERHEKAEREKAELNASVMAHMPKSWLSNKDTEGDDEVPPKAA